MNITGDINFRLMEGGEVTGGGNGLLIHESPTGAFAYHYTKRVDDYYYQLAQSDVKNAWMGNIGFSASRSWTGVKK